MSAARVYLLTHGCYSDYSVESVWSTRELAETALRSCKYQGAGIEEYWIDTPDATEPLPYWCVFFGNTTIVTLEPRRGAVCNEYVDDRGFGRCYVCAESRDVALKIASDRRAVLIALRDAETRAKSAQLIADRVEALRRTAEGEGYVLVKKDGAT